MSKRVIDAAAEVCARQLGFGAISPHVASSVINLTDLIRQDYPEIGTELVDRGLEIAQQELHLHQNKMKRLPHRAGAK